MMRFHKQHAPGGLLEGKDTRGRLESLGDYSGRYGKNVVRHRLRNPPDSRGVNESHLLGLVWLNLVSSCIRDLKNIPSLSHI
jgi:hypothetical protein